MNMENKGLGDANAEDGISIVWGGGGGGTTVETHRLRPRSVQLVCL